jgi:carboxyl-terminal processing protease
VRDDVPKDNADREVKLTDSGRTIYGGGGITPDEKIAPIKPTHFQEVLADHGSIFFNFAPHYLATHTVTKDFTVDDAVLQSFKDYLKSLQIDFTDADIAANLDWVKASIKSNLFTSAFGQTEGMKVIRNWDPQIHKALSFLPEAQALEERINAKQAPQTAHR